MDSPVQGAWWELGVVCREADIEHWFFSIEVRKPAETDFYRFIAQDFVGAGDSDSSRLISWELCGL
jgi:hypothetical protein